VAADGTFFLSCFIVIVLKDIRVSRIVVNTLVLTVALLLTLGVAIILALVCTLVLALVLAFAFAVAAAITINVIVPVGSLNATITVAILVEYWKARNERWHSVCIGWDEGIVVRVGVGVIVIIFLVLWFGRESGGPLVFNVCLTDYTEGGLLLGGVSYSFLEGLLRA
jgi:hypothetical protein